MLKSPRLVIIAVLLAAMAAKAQGRRPTIEIVDVPPAGAGPDSQGNIAGIVRGLDSPEQFKVVLYAHTDWWYVQPLVDAPFTEVDRNGRWSNWTHLGQRYAALIVRPSFHPPARVQSLPSVGGDVIASVEVAARSGKP